MGLVKASADEKGRAPGMGTRRGYDQSCGGQEVVACFQGTESKVKGTRCLPLMQEAGLK